MLSNKMVQKHLSIIESYTWVKFYWSIMMQMAGKTEIHFTDGGKKQSNRFMQYDILSN